MFRTILALVVFFSLILLVIPVVLLLIIISFGRLNFVAVEYIAPFLAWVVFKIVGINFETVQYPDERPAPAVYISNHSSTLDMFTIMALGLPNIRFIAKWEFQYNPLFLIIGRLTGQIFIRRQDSKKAVQTLQKAYARIKRQKLSIFAAPEGSRRHEGVIGTFKKGPFRMAMDLGYPIVPVYFEGNRVLSHGDSLFAKPGTCTAYIHEPIDTSDWTVEDLPGHIEAIRNRYLEWAGVKAEQETQRTTEGSDPQS
ncbi:MAG: lysophospholipid acyltransferase family protein [Balneolaceae bacterium]